MNFMCSSIILFFFVASIMSDHCLVLAMQSGRNINAKPFLPQQQQQQQQHQEQQQTQWQEEQEYAHLHGSPPHQHHQMQQEQTNLYGSPPYHQQIQQIPPQYMGEPNLYGMPSSPPQYHQHQPIQQLQEHLHHQFQPQHLGGHQQIVSSSSPQRFFSPMHSTPMADFFTSPQRMSPLLPAHYERNEPIVGGEHGDEAVKSGEKGAKDIPIGHEQSRTFNPFFASSSPSNDPLGHLTSLLQTIPQGTSLFSENPASITGTSKHAAKPLNPVRKISSSPTESSSSSGADKDNTEKFTFGTIKENLLTSMSEKEPEKPKSRGIPPGFPAKNPSDIKDVSLVKKLPKYLEAVKKPPAPPSTIKSPANEAQIKPKSPITVEKGKTASPGEDFGKQKSKPNDPDDKKSWRKHESSSSAGVSTTKVEGASSKNKYSSYKQKEQKRNRGKQKGNSNQSQGSTKMTNVAPKEACKTIPAEFLPTNKGKHGKSQVSVNPSEMAAKSNIFEELPTDDEELDTSFIEKIKLESDSEKEISGSSSDFSDPDDMGLEEETFVDALQFFEAKAKNSDGKKKKSVKQLKREKELADAKAIEEFSKKREQELEDAKGKGKAVENNKEIDEKSTNNKEKFKAAKKLMELHRNSNRVQDARMDDWARKWHRNEKNRAIKSTPTDSTRVTSEMLQETPVDHHTEIKSLLHILKYDKIMGISIDDKIDEEQTKKDIRYLLYTIQVFYETLYKYWHKNYKFHDLNEYAYIGYVLSKIGQFYSDKGTNEENLEQFERAEDSLEKSMHILSSFWMIPNYREFMESQVFSKDEGKYKFVKWMEAFEELLIALNLFDIKIKRFNKSNAKKNESFDRLKIQYKKSTIKPYFETVLNLKFRTIFGIVFIGMDKQALDTIVIKKGLLTGLKYLQNWLPDRKAELAHTRKVLWNYFRILDYVAEKEVRQDFNAYFKAVMGYPMPEGNYIEIKNGNHASLAVYSAERMLAGIFEMLRDEIGDNISSEVENALNAVKEHLHCANFLFTMYEKIYHAFDDKTNKHNVHMGVEARNFWQVVDKEKCIPAEENYRKIENSPEYQKFLQDNPRFKNKMENAIKSLDDLYIKYNIEERRKEARGECDCCKPEKGYEKDSEEEKEELVKEKELEEAGKEVTGKQEITQMQEEPIEAAALSEM